jgi:hypothetical protein
MATKRGRPFEKGHSGGPGRPKMPTEIIMLKMLSKDSAKVLLNKFLDWPLSHLQDYLKDATNPVLEFYIAKLLYTGICEGNIAPLAFLFDRLLGKVVDKVEISRPIPTVIELIGEDRRIVLGTKDKIDEVDAKVFNDQKKVQVIDESNS